MVVILRSPVLVEEKHTLQGSRRKHAALQMAETIVTEDVAGSQQEIVASVPDTAELLAREQMLLEQTKQVEAALQSAFEDGHGEGFRKGEQEGLAAYQAAASRLDAIARTMDESNARCLELAQDSMVAIAFEAICKILGDGFSTPDGVRALVKEATSRIRENSPLTIRIHPDDLKLLESADHLDCVGDTVWQADETLNAGGCVIESKSGTLDAQLDRQILRLKQVLLAARRIAPKA